MPLQQKKMNLKLIVTCLNEEGNVQEFIDDLMKNLSTNVKMALILIDNGSTDNTGSIIKLLAKKYPTIVPILRENTYEYGQSIIDTLEYPLDFTPDYIGWAPSDNQISGIDVCKTINTIIEKKPDFIKVIRYDKKYSLWRKIQSIGFNFIVSLVFQKRIKDINGSPKFFKAEFLPNLDLQSKGWFLDGEAYFKVSRLSNKSKIEYVSAKFNERTHGRSNTSWITAFELFMKVVHFRLWGMRKWSKQIKLSGKIPKE